MATLAERLTDLTPAQMEEYRSWTDAFESAWGNGQVDQPKPDEFVPDHEPPARLVLVQNVKVALEYLARNGTALDAGEFLHASLELPATMTPASRCWPGARGWLTRRRGPASSRSHSPRWPSGSRRCAMRSCSDGLHTIASKGGHSPPRWCPKARS